MKPLAEGLERVHAAQPHPEIIPQDLLDCREPYAGHWRESSSGWRLLTDAGASCPQWTYCGDAWYAGGTIMECGYRIVLRATPRKSGAHREDRGETDGTTADRCGGCADGWTASWESRAQARPAQSVTLYGRCTRFLASDVSAIPASPARKMRLPGRPSPSSRSPRQKGETELQQLSRFVPRGFLGMAYWYSLYGAHQWLFKEMLRTIAKWAVCRARPETFHTKLQLMPAPRTNNPDTAG